MSYTWRPEGKTRGKKWVNVLEYQYGQDQRDTVLFKDRVLDIYFQRRVKDFYELKWCVGFILTAYVRPWFLFRNKTGH